MKTEDYFIKPEPISMLTISCQFNGRDFVVNSHKIGVGSIIMLQLRNTSTMHEGLVSVSPWFLFM